MLCVKCGAKAVYYSIHSGHGFCTKCFMKSIENRVRTTINRYKLFDPKDRIVIAMSGGKDSQVL
ncbi:MAG: TIGR00269 family protein, partial [Candidatus Nezhaarchaeales archaeon]